MEHLRRFNEADENPNMLPTYQDILDMIAAKQLKLVNCDEQRIIESINRMKEYNRERFPNFLERPITTYARTSEPVYLISLGGSYCIVVESGTPTTIISEYELINPFIFGDIVICPGHDSITCYNMETGESKTGHIR